MLFQESGSSPRTLPLCPGLAGRGAVLGFHRGDGRGSEPAKHQYQQHYHRHRRPLWRGGNGSTDNTLAISNAIAAAAAGGNTNGLYGGTVRIPASGTYLCGPLSLKNNVDLQIDAAPPCKCSP